MKRRDFIKSSGRYLLFSGLLAISGYSIWKTQKNKGDGCDINPYCKSCRQLQDCNFPQALKQKEHGKK